MALARRGRHFVLVAIDHSIHADRKLVTFTCPADFRIEDFDAAFADVLEDPAFSTGYDRLWDLRAVRRVLDPDEVREMARVYGKYASRVRGRRVAILVDTDVFFGMARMFSAMVDNPDVEFAVFRDEAESRAWVSAGRD